MERKGKKLAVLADGHPRRLADGRNAWRKMNATQRVDFLTWIASEPGLPAGWVLYCDRRLAEMQR